ncbi:GATA zinc finger domain-containing protein 10-like isoform X1 [Drosophila nasuta]|uniref:GATA zinc finger domain-containing protein 10-like isoform X1 n=2 Tax=Drosophila nasuta TaxID=42062 RepID=UPI00295EFD11|nr:GATA zinc finger domain-containing protein 10-like isoform X1 [Drosophila nasuta]
MSEQFHQNAIESTELVKRKLAGLASNSKQRRLQPATNAQEMSNYFGQTTPFLHSYQTKPSPTGSTFETDVKFEMQFDVDNIPSTSNQEFLTNFPLSPVSSYSTADSISPVQQQQQQQPQMQQQLPQQQQQQMYLGSSPSPSFGSEMKYEVPQMQIDSIPTTCVQNICTDFSMSPGSSYSTTDGIAPMMTVQQQQIQQQQQQQQQQFQQQQQQLPLQNCPNELEMTNALNHMTMQDNSYPSKMMQLSNQVHTKTSFNGGSFIATNSLDVQMNNNNNAFSPNMNTTNLSFSPQNCMPYELNPQQSQSPSQFQQVQYQQQQQQQQQQLMQQSQQQQQLQQQQLQQHQQQLAQQQQQHQQQQQQQQLVQQEALDFLGDLGFDNTNITESAEIRYINDLQKTIATLDSQSPT